MEKILIVEDERQLIKLMKKHLEENGYEILTATDGEEALKITEKTTPDLIILDIVLPGIGGYEVCAKMKAQESTQSTPIIMQSSRGGDIDRVMGLRCGANDYIVKPYDPKVVLKTVRDILG